MRLICPHCMSGVTVPDDIAGKEAACPNCGKSFPTPARYSASVMPEPSGAVAGPSEPARTSPHPEAPPSQPVAAVPPGYVPPATTPGTESGGFLPPASHSADAPAVAGYTRTRGVTLSPAVIQWLPPVLLTLVFVFSFFPWVGCYAGSTVVYSQRPWGALFGSTPYRNFKLEEAGAVPGGWLDKVPSDWVILVPFFLLLVVALIFAWAERGLSYMDPRKLPPLRKLWPWRNAIIAACAALALLLFFIELANGMSMERAINRHIAEEFAARRQEALGSPAQLEKLDYQQEQKYREYNVEYTWWLYLALFCQVVAVLAILIGFGLDRRGNKPPPKLLLHY